MVLWSLVDSTEIFGSKIASDIDVGFRMQGLCDIPYNVYLAEIDLSAYAIIKLLAPVSPATSLESSDESGLEGLRSSAGN